MLSQPLHLLLLVCLLAALTACGEEDTPATNPSDENNAEANNSTPNNAEPGNNSQNNSEPGNNGQNNAEPGNNSEPGNNAEPGNNSQNNSEPGNNSQNNNTPEPCDLGALIILSPTANQSISADQDTSPEPGIQIQVRLASAIETGAVVTIENQTTGQSVGTIIEGAETIVNGVTLTQGDNTLIAFADTEMCFAQSDAVQVTLEDGPLVCADDEACPEGNLCEDGTCAACEDTCTQDTDCQGDDTCNNGCCIPAPEPVSEYRYVMIEDLTNPVSGSSPGADVDAIGLIKRGGERFATSVEDYQIGRTDGNNFQNINDLLGPPDADCQVRNFAALGGQALGGYVIVSFATQEEDVTIEEGDTLNIYEVGSTLCGQYQDDPYRVSVSVITTQGSFIEVGSGGNGSNQILVPGLP